MVFAYSRHSLLLSAPPAVLPQAMFELVTSEASYYKSLSLLVSHFMENERLKKLLHPSEAHILFSNVLDVLAVSER